MSQSCMPRQPEPELMDLPHEAEAYAGADFGDVNAAFVARLLELVADKDAVYCVDLGTGPADIPLRISKQRPGWGIVAVDAAWAMLVHARQAITSLSPRPRILPLLADAKRLPIATASCSVVISNSILHHVADTGHLWNEVRRMVIPHGWVFFRDLARPHDTSAARGLVEQHAGKESPLLQQEFYRSLLAAYTPAEVRTQLVRAGLGTLQCCMSSDRHLDVYGRV